MGIGCNDWELSGFAGCQLERFKLDALLLETREAGHNTYKSRVYTFRVTSHHPTSHLRAPHVVQVNYIAHF